ncbi:EAL domain-containing protein [Sphingomonas sp. 4RDLI-65]|uniref:sensor domain-containing phosphodiesterase n=1 Tax=Sphingomonas sp. 4RDLI-65 TaxID=3111641 RepID=UPI003C1E6D27
MTDFVQPSHDAELARLTALKNMMILDTPAHRDFDEITRLAALALGAETCAVSLVDDRRAWFKSSVGMPATDAARKHAFCTLALDSTEPLVILDTHAEPRLAGNPFTMGKAGFRFYAGAPLIVAGGHCLGTLCVLDRTPRAALSDDQVRTLTSLAGLVVDLIQARRYRQIGEIAAQVVDVTSDAILCSDQHGTITFWNRSAERMFGYPAAVALGKPLDLIVPNGLATARDSGHVAGGANDPVGASVELMARRADGSEFPIELSLGRWGDPDTGHGFAGIIRDTSARKLLEAEREQAKSFLDSVITHLPAMLFVKDVASRRYLLLNRAGETLTGLPLSDVVGRTDRDLFAHGAEYEARDSVALSTGGLSHFESDFKRTDGTIVTLRTKRIAIDGPDRRAQYILGMSEDVTETRRAQAEVLRLAHYDSLTGLRNRGSYVEKMEMLLGSGAPFALLSIDLDRFKSINDHYGHLAGDDVLAQIGDRLRKIVTSGDILARVGGDEFVLLVTGDAPGERARLAASAIQEAVSTPVATKWATVQLGASIGIVVCPEDGDTSEGLRQCADLALYRAKAEGRGSICFFSAEMDAAARDRRLLERDLRHALDAGEITLVYQPVLSAATGQITSAEALARWTHPVRGPIPPALFIAIAEESGLIEQLGALILSIACADAMTWPKDIFVAVNVSPIQVHSERLCNTVKDVLASTGMPARRLQLEVTESLFLRDVDHVFGQLDQLRSLGIQILMDDFGVGYSSLSYFERFPFDKVKIDQSFVREMGTSRAARAIIRAVVGLGTALEMGVVAEGVETEEQMIALVAAGCTHLQGYLFSKPVARERIAHLIASPADLLAIPRSVEPAVHPTKRGDRPVSRILLRS